MSVRTASAEDGAVRRLTLDAGKGNIVDAKLVAAFSDAHQAAVANPGVAAILVDAAGNHFSFGASVEEHQPAMAAGMLAALHGLIYRLLESPVPVVFAVKGQCLGGGLELVLAGSRTIAHASAKFGQPEIKLGVFAPTASALLPLRIGQARAEDLLLSGRSVGAVEALSMGLVDEVCGDADPTDRGLAWIRASVMAHSRSSLRFATTAARKAFATDAIARIKVLERLYLDELMATPDAKEGIQAFIEKRPARWTR